MAPKHRLSSCLIQKNMSTLIAAILCFLYSPERFIRAGRNINTEQGEIHFCRGKNEINSGKHPAEDVIRMVREGKAEGW